MGEIAAMQRVIDEQAEELTEALEARTAAEQLAHLDADAIAQTNRRLRQPTVARTDAERTRECAPRFY